MKYKVPKEIPIVFHNGSTYDYHFIIKRLAEEFKGQFECLGEFKGQFECLGENTEKYITFSLPIKKDDNLSEINKKECPECIKRKIKSECEFIGFKTDRSHCKCKECGKRSTKSKGGLIKKFPRIY